MIDVKCFTFFTTHKFLTSEIDDAIDENYGLIFQLGDLSVSPSLNFTSINTEIGEYSSENVLRGFFTEAFRHVKTEIEKGEKHIIINSTFILEFGLDDTISLEEDEITYIEDDSVYLYKVTPSFCRHNAPPLTTSVTINSENHLIAKKEIKEMLI